MGGEVALGQLLRHMIPSDRVLIEDAGSNVLYKGFVGCLQYESIDETRKVKRFGLKTDIFRKENRATYEPQQVLGKEVPVESISSFCFCDLQMMIYTRIVLGD